MFGRDRQLPSCALFWAMSNSGMAYRHQMLMDGTCVPLLLIYIRRLQRSCSQPMHGVTCGGSMKIVLLTLPCGLMVHQVSLGNAN